MFVETSLLFLGSLSILLGLRHWRLQNRKVYKVIQNILPFRPPVRGGSLTVFTGPMFSNKTSHLISNITCCADISEKHKTTLINHSFDNRDEEHKVSSHSSTYKGLSDKVVVQSCSNLKDADVDDFCTIGIDEAQFFGDLVETVEKWLNKGKHIVVSGLDSGANGKIFGHIHELLHLADSFTKLSAVCTICLEETGNIVPAPFTCKRSSNGKLVDIGNCDKYYPTCREHQTMVQ